MSLRSRDRNVKVALRVVSVAAVVVGILTLLGVRPMNNRTIEIALGTASLMAGLLLWGVTMRLKAVTLEDT